MIATPIYQSIDDPDGFGGNPLGGKSPTNLTDVRLTGSSAYGSGLGTVNMGSVAGSVPPTYNIGNDKETTQLATEEPASTHSPGRGKRGVAKGVETPSVVWVRQ